MKPIIIYQDKNTSKISLTKKEFEDYIQQSYTEGYNAGFNYAASLYNKPTISPTWPTPYYYSTGTGKQPDFDFTKVTCAETPITDSLTGETANARGE